MSTYTPIASQTVSGVSTVTFSSLPQNYTDLIIVSNIAFNNSDSLSFRFNGDTSSSTLYSWTVLTGNGSSATSLRGSNQAKGLADYNGYPTSTVGEYVSILQVMNYSNSSTYKTVLSRGNQAGHGTDAIVNLYRSTNPITSITLGMGTAQTTNFASNSTITIYGVAAGNSSAKASGGNIVTTDGSYWYHTFTSSGIFTPSEALTCDYLVVAGGAGGGLAPSGGGSGGGGAGGLRSTVTATGGGGTLESALSLISSAAYQVLIGAGGSAGSSTYPTNGGNSSINGPSITTITSIGGGASSVLGSSNAVSGGSGGGGGYQGNGAAGTANQGYAGGNGTPSGTPFPAGGGGGAGATGVNGSGSNAGAGGNGVAVAITGSSITYAGGGGGGVRSGGSAGSGGTGGGGAGGISSATSGTAYTGGGGGGSSDANPGGNGGSGIIIIRYAV
jgi:hypothetical protein